MGSITPAPPSSGGNVVGPASSTDNALVIWDGTTGKLVQVAAGWTVSDTGTMNGPNGIEFNSNTNLFTPGASDSNYQFARLASGLRNAAYLYWQNPANNADDTHLLHTGTASLALKSGDNSDFGFFQAKLTTATAATTGLVAGALSALTTASIVIYDSTGQAYRVPCLI